MDNQALARVIADALDKLVDTKVKAALADRTADRLEAHTDQPEPRRVTCAAAAAGEVEGAIRSGRRWVAPRASWASWRARRAATPTPIVNLDAVRAAARKVGR